MKGRKAGMTITVKKSPSLFRKPIPKGVVEVKDIGTDGGIVERRDGALLLAQGGGISDSAKVPGNCRISEDGGTTWGSPQPVSAEIGVGGLIRLQSGALAAYGRKTSQGAKKWEYYFCRSMDEGQTWSEPALIADYPNYYANLDVVGDRVMLRYSRGTPLLGIAEQNLQKAGNRPACVSDRMVLCGAVGKC